MKQNLSRLHQATANLAAAAEPGWSLQPLSKPEAVTSTTPTSSISPSRAVTCQGTDADRGRKLWDHQQSSQGMDQHSTNLDQSLMVQDLPCRPCHQGWRTAVVGGDTQDSSSEGGGDRTAEPAAQGWEDKWLQQAAG